MAGAACLLSFQSTDLRAADQAPVTLTRLDCGTISANNAASLSDTHGYDGQRLVMPVSCYLVRHGEDYLLWDAGLSAALVGVRLNDRDAFSSTVTRSLVDELAQLGVDPARIRYVAVSHYHLDHVGQASSFPKATLLIGSADWAAFAGGKVPPLADADGLAPWLKGGGAVRAIDHDLDLFGDGSVVIFATPGHTPGHKSLLVRLAHLGPVLLTGDLAHSQRNYDRDDMADGYASRADLLASLDRFKRSAANLKATVIIGHEPADIAKLPAFPKAAD